MTDFDRENSDRTVLKRISSLGGVQIFNILVALVRGKFIAVLLGPEGIGVASLYTSATATVQQFAALGLNTTLVKEVAAASDDTTRLRTVLTVSLRLILLTSLLGAVACMLLAPVLSMLTFGNTDHTVAFILLSLSVALAIAGAGYMSLLQGLSEIKRLSKASVVGGLAGLLFGVPLYYLLGLRGIVPTIIILTFTTFLFYYISFRRADSAGREHFSLAAHKPLIKKLLSLGFVLMVGSLAGTLANYVINMFVRSVGSEESVGLSQAANSLTNQYVGIVFSALAMDYFPRLSKVIESNELMSRVVNRQTEIVSLIMAPLVCALILTAPIVIRLLLSSEFMPAIPLMRWMGLGILVQAISFPLGYIYVAKNNKRVYMWCEVIIGNLLWVLLSMLFFHLYSLIGLGITLLVRNAIDLIIAIAVNRRLYSLRIDRSTITVTTLALLAGGACFAASFLPHGLDTAAMGAITLLTAACSALTLRKRLRSS